MEPRHFRCFLAIADTLSITRAAERLQLPRPAARGRPGPAHHRSRSSSPGGPGPAWDGSRRPRSISS
ncbi:helix-turn-helix domain-containing protein [Streptomyces sioyaensis]|uniref:helix-turn-helix domain-containing protein n=1 Tax=Streptomyces sioyaensis TaxID=67364 RepID=UPI003D760F0B